MSVVGETQDLEIGNTSLLDLAPSPSRVDQLDSKLRLRLAQSFEYLGGLPSFEEEQRAALSSLVQRLKAGAVSPWVFCLYSRLVAELSNNAQDSPESLNAVVEAAALPASQGVIALRDSNIPDRWWDHLQLLLDTERSSPFRPVAPAPERFSRAKDEIAASLELMQRIDPAWHDEIGRLVRLMILGSPQNPDPESYFDGATTFFFWGATLLNAGQSRDPIGWVDLLVHESSHVLLFGLSSEGGLTRNSGEERYDSPIRADQRPIDGIFHACFVTTRVHLAMKRLLDSGSLGQDDSRLALERLQGSGEASRESLAMLMRHAELTGLGKTILGEIQDYWASQPSN